MHLPARIVLPLLLLLPAAGCLDRGDGADDPAIPPVLQWTDAIVTPLDASASEVSIAVNPNDPLHVVASANSQGGFGVYTSLDGGCTWASELLDGGLAFFGPTGAATLAFSDPAVVFTPDGTLRIAGLAYLPTSQVFVASRAAPDAPWTSSTVWRSEVAATFNDKEWIGASPTTGTLVVAWQREPAMDSLRTAEQTVHAATGVAADVDVGLVVVSRSTDGGATWSLPVTVGDSLHNNGTQVVATADGAFHLVWVDYEQPALVHSVSTDDGATWSDPVNVAPLAIVGPFGGFSRMHTLPGLATDGTDLSVVWHDAASDTADVRVATWSNGTWGPAERLPDDAGDPQRIQLYPWVAYGSDGTLHVTYYGGALDGNVTYRHLARGAAGWSKPVDLGPAFALVGAAGAADIGDYTGVAAGNGNLYAAWAQPKPAATGGSDVHVAALRGAPCPVA